MIIKNGFEPKDKLVDGKILISYYKRKIKFRIPEPVSNLAYPSYTLYPSENLYPMAPGGE